MASKSREMKFPAGLYTAFAFCVLLVLGRWAWGEISIRINPDTRGAEPMAREVLGYRARLDSAATGVISDEKVTYFAELSQCQMQLMGFEAGPKPEKPEPPKKQGEGIVAELRYRQALKYYPTALQIFPQRLTLWEENNKTRGDKFIFMPGKVPERATKEEIEKKATKYLYRRNIFGYVAQARYSMVSDMFYQLQANEYWRGQLGWLKAGWEERQKNTKPAEGLDGKEKAKWLREVAFREYLDEVYLSQPLICPRKVDGSCMLTWDGTTSKEDADNGRPCLLVKPLAEAVTRANRRMHEAKKGEIEPMICYRNNLHQAVLWVSIAGEGCTLEGGRPGITLPGTSMHGLGMAMDISNWKQAQVYLAAEAGMMCDYIPNDDAHCAMGEVELSRRTIIKKRLLDALADGRDGKEFLREHGGEIWQSAKDGIKEKIFR